MIKYYEPNNNPRGIRDASYASINKQLQAFNGNRERESSSCLTLWSHLCHRQESACSSRKQQEHSHQAVKIWRWSMISHRKKMVRECMLMRYQVKVIPPWRQRWQLKGRRQEDLWNAFGQAEILVWNSVQRREKDVQKINTLCKAEKENFSVIFS